MVAACNQAIAVIAAGAGAVLWMRYQPLAPVFSTEYLGEKVPDLAASALSWINLLTAIGVALTKNRFVDATSVRLRDTSKRLYPTHPSYAVKTLTVQFSIVSIAFAALVLSQPPLIVVELAGALGYAEAASFAWPGVTSIGAAAFGANAHAAAKALVRCT